MVERRDRQAFFVIMDFHIELHHLIDIEGLDAASSRHADGVAHESERVMVLEEIWVFRENRALLGPIAVGLQGHEPLFAGAREKLNEHFHVRHVFVLAYLEPPMIPVSPAASSFRMGGGWRRGWYQSPHRR